MIAAELKIIRTDELGQSNMKNYELRQALKAIKGKAGIE